MDVYTNCAGSTYQHSDYVADEFGKIGCREHYKEFIHLITDSLDKWSIAHLPKTDDFGNSYCPTDPEHTRNFSCLYNYGVVRYYTADKN